MSLMEFSSRMKDYYDIYYIANKFDFDGEVLTEALRKTFSNREHSFTLEQFDQADIVWWLFTSSRRWFFP